MGMVDRPAPQRLTAGDRAWYDHCAAITAREHIAVKEHKAARVVRHSSPVVNVGRSGSGGRWADGVAHRDENRAYVERFNAGGCGVTDRMRAGEPLWCGFMRCGSCSWNPARTNRSAT